MIRDKVNTSTCSKNDFMMRRPPTGYKVITKSKATGLILNQIRNLVTLRQQETSKQNPGLRSLPLKAKSLYDDRCILRPGFCFDVSCCLKVTRFLI